MINWISALGLSVSICCCVNAESVFAQQLNQQDVQLIRDTAASICNTITQTKGSKTDVQLQGDVKAQLGGLVEKITGGSGVSGTGSLTTQEFEGLSREATASALESTQGCRERVFNKMFDKLSTVAPRPTLHQPKIFTHPDVSREGHMTGIKATISDNPKGGSYYHIDFYWSGSPNGTWSGDQTATITFQGAGNAALQSVVVGINRSGCFYGGGNHQIKDGDLSVNPDLIAGIGVTLSEVRNRKEGGC